MSEAVSCEVDVVAHYRRLTPLAEVDAISFYVTAVDGAGDKFLLRHTLGQDCVDDACRARRDAIAREFRSVPIAERGGWIYADAAFPGWGPGGAGFAVVSVGGEDLLVRSLDALAKHIAPIANAAAAQAWASMTMRGATCEATPNARAGDGFYELRRIEKSCADTADVTSETLIRVYRDGRIEELRSRVLSSVDRNGGCPIAGRRSVGFVPGGHQGAALQAALGETACLEAAAVFAFDELARELQRFGAPVDLIDRALTARSDEERHAQTMAAHAERYGAKVRPGESQPHRYGTLLDLALHNAREGCVRETYGALVGLHQAACASDVLLREDMVTIAREEVSHASWSHDLDEWIAAQLDARERAQVHEAKREAFRELALECNHDPPADVASIAGLPRAHVARAMIDGLNALLLG